MQDDMRAPTPTEGDAFVREVAQGRVELTELASRLRMWGVA
jgi:hypothetical protein